MWFLKKNMISILSSCCRFNYKVCYIDNINIHKFSVCCKFLKTYKINKNWITLKHNRSALFYFFNSLHCNNIGLYVFTDLLTYENLLDSKSQLDKNGNSAVKECEGGDSDIFSIQTKNDRLCKLAEEAWLKGNIISSFEQFTGIYEKEDKILKRKLIQRLQHLIFHSIENSGIAIMGSIVHYVKIFSIENEEFTLLTTLWFALFTSSLYEDNCLSVTLLEVPKFKKNLEPFLPYLGASFLKNDEIGLYQNLIETSLCHNMNHAAEILLHLLFDYYYKTGYYLGCSAVYKCCDHLEIKLTSDQIYKYNVLKATDTKMKSKIFKMHRPKDIVYKF